MIDQSGSSFVGASNIVVDVGRKSKWAPKDDDDQDDDN